MRCGNDECRNPRANDADAIKGVAARMVDGFITNVCEHCRREIDARDGHIETAPAWQPDQP